MREQFSKDSKNLNQSSANESVSDGGPNETTDIGKGHTPDVEANANSENGADMSDKTPHLKPHYESESLDTERSGSTAQHKDKTSLSSLAGSATGPSTPTRPPCTPRQNRNPHDTPKILPISGSYAQFAEKILPEELRVDLDLAEGATYRDGLAAVLFRAAIKGSVRATHEIREGIEGRADQRRNPVAAGPITIHVEYEPPLSKMMPKDSADTPNE